MVQGYEFFQGPWQQLETYLPTVHQFYDENVSSRGLGTIWEVTKTKIVERRKWAPSLSLYSKHFEEILEELNIVYLPKQIEPGPGVLFPQTDYRGRFTHGKFHPFYELTLKDGIAKYGFIGRKETITGPMWFGNTDRILQAIAKHRSVGLVEGPYDWLACRLLRPDAPVISTGTKSINEHHIQYLMLLGVLNVQLMLDNEPSRDNRTYGAGLQAMYKIKKDWDGVGGLRFHVNHVPNDDPSMCLETYKGARDMQQLLTGIF